jgi:ABC-type Mn2+/Zn2+ transport system ATPase subunit
MALELRNVGVTVGRARLIEDVSLRLEAGSLTIIPGANGAGKSTALAVLAGDLRPSAGHPVPGHGIRDVNRVGVLLCIWFTDASSIP